MKYVHSKLKKFLVFTLAGCFVLLSIIPLRLAIATYQAPTPQAILVLGGNPDREVLAAQMSRLYPTLDIWVSSGSLPQYIQGVFRAEAIPLDRLHLDYRAVDTVTNFTTLVSDFHQRQIQHVFLITSDYHMRRAIVIATLVLGSHGITFTPIQVATNISQESIFRVLRDSGRSILWIVTGRTGASFRNS
jgi:uncharacterized SAM-binding protein YcdF (DUF218 family)